MNDQTRHHALATPTHVEAWATALLEEYTVATAYDYWRRVADFYGWLRWHCEYPHRYTPVLMAVIANSASETIWRYGYA